MSSTRMAFFGVAFGIVTIHLVTIDVSLPGQGDVTTGRDFDKYKLPVAHLVTLSDVSTCGARKDKEERAVVSSAEVGDSTRIDRCAAEWAFFEFDAS